MQTGHRSLIEYTATIPALMNSEVPADHRRVLTQVDWRWPTFAPWVRALPSASSMANVMDAEPPVWVGGSLYSNYDPFGRRFSVSLSYKH